MDIVFCADRRVLPGLHVAAFSVLSRIGKNADQTTIWVFSDSLTQDDLNLLRRTLDGAQKPYELNHRAVDPAAFTGFPPLNGSWAAYYRLFAAQKMDVERFLYLDVDMLCRLDVCSLTNLDMGDYPVAWVSEASMHQAVDQAVAGRLDYKGEYFNSGMLLVNVAEWKRQSVTQRAMEYVAEHSPDFHDQSALNVVLHGKTLALGKEYNCMSNMRGNWPELIRSSSSPNQIIHFIDYPKPWDLFAEWIHPLANLWWRELEHTAMRDFRSWHRHPGRRLPKSAKDWVGYKKVIKDRLLFTGYERNWLKNIKGVPGPSMSASSQ